MALTNDDYTLHFAIGILFSFSSSFSSSYDEYEVKISFHNDLRYNITRGITMKAGLVFKESQLDWPVLRHLICYFLMKRTEFLIVWPSVSPRCDYLFCLYV